jgi:hypothetical protein
MPNYQYATGGNFNVTHLGRFLASLQFASLTKTYQGYAEAIAKTFGCANCRGTETLRSCIGAYRQIQAKAGTLNTSQSRAWTDFLNKHGATLTKLEALLVNTHHVDFGAEFGGAFSQEILKKGVLLDGKPVNAFDSAWYGAFKILLVAKNNSPPLKGVLSKGTGLALTKQSAHAHAVVARASIAVGVRLGFLEYAAYLASGAKSQVRPIRAVARQALTLVDKDATLHWIVDEEIAWLKKVWEGTEHTLKKATSATLATELVGRLVTALGRLTVSSGTSIRANCFALCSVFRAAILNLAWRRAHANKWSGTALRAKLGKARELITYYPKTKPGNSNPFIHLKEVETELSKRGSNDILEIVQRDCTTANDWLSAGDVEFAKQCGTCEDGQGALDLVGRFVDSRAERGQVLDLMVGVLYSIMTDTPSAGDTPFDLACAVACHATSLIGAKLHGLAPGSPTVKLMMEAYDTEAPLFVAYMEALFLGIGMQGTTHLPKVIEEAHERVVEPQLTVQARPLSPLETYRGPTLEEMENAARALGLTWKDLRIDQNALSTIVRAYRREALIFHPDRPLGDKVQFQLVQGAREILEGYFSGDKKKVNELLMIKQD